MKTLARLSVAIAITLSSALAGADGTPPRPHLFVCRSPRLAFDFWNALGEMHRQGVTITSKIAQEVCDGMKAGDDRQCIRIEADAFKPVASGWQGAMAMSDGKTKMWFHNPDALGWIHPDYYVQFLNNK